MDPRRDTLSPSNMVDFIRIPRFDPEKQYLRPAILQERCAIQIKGDGVDFLRFADFLHGLTVWIREAGKGTL